jgi:hypothetical protein
MIIKFETELRHNFIEDVFVTALEGGSNYWFYINNYDYEKVRSAYPEESFSIGLYNYVTKDDNSISVYNVEDESDKLGVLSLKSIENNIKIFARDYPDELYNLNSEEYDAIDADICMQVLVMREVIYG